MLDHQNMVFGTAVRLLANRSEAEDIAQDVFLKAFHHFENLRDNPSAGGWLRTVVTNLCLNHLTRYRSRWNLFTEWRSSDGEELGPAAEMTAPSDPLSEIAAAEQNELLEQALQKLPDSQRVPIVLFHLENHSYEQIAAELGISLGKVKTDIFRGREALRKVLQRKTGFSEIVRT